MPLAVVADNEDGHCRRRTAPRWSTVPPGGVNFRALPARLREDLLDAAAVAGRRPQPGRQVRREPDVALDRDRQEARGDAARRFGHGERLQLQLERARTPSRDSSRRSPTSSLIDPTIARLRDQEVALDGRVVDLAAEDQLEIAAEAGQRRPQLVGDGRDEAASARRRGRASGAVLRSGAELAGDDREGGAGVAERAAAGAGRAGGLARIATVELEAEDDAAGARDAEQRVGRR